MALLAAVYVASAVAGGLATFNDDDPEGWAEVGLTIAFALALGGGAWLLRVVSIKEETPP